MAMIIHTRKLATGLALAVGLILADQLSKIAMMRLLNHFTPADSPAAIDVLPFFRLVTWWNKGVSFGMFSGHDGSGAWVLTALALVISAVMLVWMVRTDRWLSILALGTVIGGALGNVIDRVRFGAVFDFLFFYWRDWGFPAFNLADSAITIGVILLLIDGVLADRQDRNKPGRDKAPHGT